ncbi:hypothetical protein I6G82_08400 [Lysinibacillus macroides]|uniref:Uncharacterized protein n=1 Tax=Lysinibacillus macroides TaxID=33935 RepID=A0A0N0UWI8_9BACI|nr:hypothetical protein [Lysinibacillus macroides]KOY81565.1 hypothetical protein ADM90_14285 [Lysinibacillus macroides]QPR69592.1 hypothetical protein I6G82_08400 [Lysinibacillus macroides]
MNIQELEVPVGITQPLPAGQVRYSQSSYVGEASTDIVIEGSVEDVLKVLEATKRKKKTDPNVVADVIKVIEKMLEEELDI